MSNEEPLDKFEKWLPQRLPVGIAAPKVLGVVREFAKTTDLAEATDEEIDAFLRGDVGARSLVGRTVMRAKVRLLYNEDEIKYAMLLFRDFRNSVLKNQPKDKTQ